MEPPANGRSPPCNGMHDKVLCYLGPSLDSGTARSILPAGIFLPPAKHADIISHLYQYEPTHILLVDGTFSQDLPVWHKECAFAALRGVRIYGASSMGALRASELADHGIMTGCGKIFHWYHEGVIDADDEVCLVYHQTPSGEYVAGSTPLVNYRAGLMEAVTQGLISSEEAEHRLAKEKSLHYSERTASEYVFDQKREDAIELLTDFRDLPYGTDLRPTLSYVSRLFKAMLERERRVEFNETVLTLQNIDSYISLHSPNHHQIRWDATNRALALILADVMEVTATEEEIEAEWTTFCARHHLPTWDSFQDWLKANAINHDDFSVITIQNARIRKLQRAHITSSMFSRQTKTILDYLRSHDQLSPWIEDCADAERKIVDKDNSESLNMDLSTDLGTLLKDHASATGLEISETLHDYVQDTGIGSLVELRVCLERLRLSRK